MCWEEQQQQLMHKKDELNSTSHHTIRNRPFYSCLCFTCVFGNIWVTNIQLTRSYALLMKEEKNDSPTDHLLSGQMFTQWVSRDEMLLAFTFTRLLYRWTSVTCIDGQVRVSATIKALIACILRTSLSPLSSKQSVNSSFFFAVSIYLSR